MEHITGRYSKGLIGRLLCWMKHKEVRLSGFTLKNKPHDFCTRCGMFRKVKKR